MKKLFMGAVLLMLILAFIFPAESAEAAQKVQYGDTITVKVEKRAEGAVSQIDPSIAKWHKAGRDTFKVLENAPQFDDCETDEGVTKEDWNNLRKCLGKKVNQKFTIVVGSGDGVYYTRYTIKKISRPKVTNKIIANAYKKYITSSAWKNDGYCGTADESELKFALIDINNDGYKEMYITGDDGYHANICAYLGGMVTVVDSSFAGIYKYYNNTNLIYSSTSHGGAYEESYSKYVNGVMKVLANIGGQLYLDENDNFIKNYSYYINGKTTTKAKYNNYVKSLKKGKKVAKITLHKNTEKNRKKYIK